MKILAIETSCDETSIALLKAESGLPAGKQDLKLPKFKIIENIISSQIKIHRPFGGVVPNLAKREHIKNLPIIFKKFIKSKPDLLAVTVGPGLEPCLWAGINFAENLQKKYFPKTEIIGANHLEGHLYSFLLAKKPAKIKLFPAIALIVSGGHTILLLMRSLTKLEKLGETQDDAVGEAFDKTAKMLNLPYPGGPEIEKISLKGNPNAIKFPRPMINQKNYNFSFSGLKTSVLYYLRDNPVPTGRQAKIKKPDIAASFQKAAIDVLAKKTETAVKEFDAKSIMLSGGVAANKLLRKELENLSSKLKISFFAPPQELNTDNAAIIAVSAYINFLKKKNRRLIADSNLNL